MRRRQERIDAREGLVADVQAGFDQFMSRGAKSFDTRSGRQLTERINSCARGTHADPGPLEPFEIVKAVGLAFPEAEAATGWASGPVLKARGCFMAGLAAHRSVDPCTLVVRCALDGREPFLEDAPDTYYVTDYYRPYPVVLARLARLNADALRDLLAVSWRIAMQKAPKPALRRRRRSPERRRF